MPSPSSSESGSKSVSDPAAELAVAMALVQAAKKTDGISEAYNGFDELMREAMRVGREFEAWACEHIEFNDFESVWEAMRVGREFEAWACEHIEFNDFEYVWPYFLLGFPRHAALAVGDDAGLQGVLTDLSKLNAEAWPKIAASMKLPLRQLSAAVAPKEARRTTLEWECPGRDGSEYVICAPDAKSGKRHTIAHFYNADDARLGVAAPKLVAALREVDEMLSAHPEAQKGTGKVHYLMHAARAAIAETEPEPSEASSVLAGDDADELPKPVGSQKSKPGSRR